MKKGITKEELLKRAKRQRKRYLRPCTELEACLREKAKDAIKALKTSNQNLYTYNEVKHILEETSGCWELYGEY